MVWGRKVFLKKIFENNYRWFEVNAHQFTHGHHHIAHLGLRYHTWQNFILFRQNICFVQTKIFVLFRQIFLFCSDKNFNFVQTIFFVLFRKYFRLFCLRPSLSRLVRFCFSSDDISYFFQTDFFGSDNIFCWLFAHFGLRYHAGLLDRFVKIILTIFLFYIYHRHSNRKPERSWNKHNIMVSSNSRPHIQTMSLTLEATQMQRIYVKLLETSLERRTPFHWRSFTKMRCSQDHKNCIWWWWPSLILIIWGWARTNQRCNFFFRCASIS